MFKWPIKFFWLRVALWTVLLLVSGFLYLSYRWSLKAPPDYLALARPGAPIVEAIYRYRNDRGLWPEYLDELVPAYFPAAPKNWDKDWDYDSGNRLARRAAPDESVEYRFVPGEEGWRRIDIEGAPRSLRLPQLRPDPTLAPAQLQQNKLAELTRRIRREPTEVVPYRQKATTLLALHRPDDARAVCQTALLQIPDHWWPRMALATLTHQPAATTPASSPSSAPATAPFGGGEQWKMENGKWKIPRPSPTGSSPTPPSPAA